ncbi:MAG: alpha/beta hydrolase [Acidobacteriota bacterium]|nr:alpha/beta hydrolase [Acidobacteriota bacterium]
MAKSRVWRAIKWAIGIVIILLIVFFYAIVPWFFTNIVTRNNFRYHDPNAGKTPASFHMAFSDVNFASSDGIPLKGWYIPAHAPDGGAALGTIIYCHGFHRSRIEMLPMAVYGHSLGYDGLLFDFRNHGQSGGKVTSLGYWERLDVEAAARYAVSQEDAAQPVIFWGVSMGAAAALMAAADDPSAGAVIADSTFLSFRGVIHHHYRLVIGIIRRHWWWFPPLPSFPIVDEVVAWSAWRAHFDPNSFDLQNAVKRIGKRPILFVAVRGDERMPPSIARDLYALDESPMKQIVILPGHRHGEGFNDARTPYQEAVKTFLSSLGAETHP